MNETLVKFKYNKESKYYPRRGVCLDTINRTVSVS